MTEITINDVKYTNVPNKKAGTKFASALTQSNISVSQSVADYMNSANFYTLVNAVDINWNGIEVAANSYINTTSDLIKFILSVSNVDLSDYATMSYVQEALSGKANANDVYTKTEVDKLIPDPVDLSSYTTTSYVTTELDKKADKGDIVQADMCETDSTSKSYVLNNPYQYHIYNWYGSKYYCYNLIIPHNTSFEGTNISNSNTKNCVIIGNYHNIYNGLNSGLIQGYKNKIQNDFEVAFGQFNSSTRHTSDNSLKTVFSIGNGDLVSRHNALEVKGDGQIYIADTKAGTPYSLQSKLNSKADANDVYTKQEVDNMIPESGNLSNYVSYTQANSYYMTVESSTKQVINSSKTFVGNKRINFRQGKSTDKLGFTLYNSDENEVGGFEWRPDTIDGKPLMSLQQYVNADNMSIIPQSYLGFRQTQGNYKYHLLAPIPADVATIETITSKNYKNFFIPLVFKNGNNKVYTDCTGLVDLSSIMPDLNDYTTTSYVTTELNKKADKTQLPDMTQYVSITSYNALAARVEELASWIVSYHSTPTPSGTDPDIYFDNSELTVDYNMEPNKLNGNEITQALSGNDTFQSAWIVWSTDNSSIATVNHGGYVVAQGNGTVNIIAEFTAHDKYNSKTVQYQLTIVNYSDGGGGKQYPYAHWYENGTELSELVLVEGGSGTRTLTFSATPSDSWSFMDPMVSGISVDTKTGTITITESNLMTSNMSITANRPEDSSYYYGSVNLNIRVLPAGSDPKFFYEQDSVNLDNNSGTITPPLHDEYMGQEYAKTYTSADTNVATVDDYGMISFVGAGNTTVTATTTNGTDTHTATITVYCTVNKQYPSVSFEYNGTPYSGGTLPVVAPFTGTIHLTNMTPATGWVITDPMIQGITVLQNVIEVQDLSQGTYIINANYPEDSDYYPGMTSLTLRVLPSGTNPNFFYEQESVNLDNQAMSQSTPMLYNNTGFAAMPTYKSADIAIATVDENGMILFVSGGTTTVTASITDGVDTYTTSITVNCNVMNA